MQQNGICKHAYGGRTGASDNLPLQDARAPRGDLFSCREQGDAWPVESLAMCRSSKTRRMLRLSRPIPSARLPGGVCIRTAVSIILASCATAGVEYRTGKRCASVSLRWANEDWFGLPRVGAVVFPRAAKALRQSQAGPVGDQTQAIIRMPMPHPIQRSQTPHSRARPKQSATPPTLRCRWQSTRGCCQSSPDRQSIDAAPSTSDSEPLRSCPPGEHASTRIAFQVRLTRTFFCSVQGKK